MRKIFSIRGRTLDENDAPLVGLVLAVVDADLLCDDLIAVGHTGWDGEFSLSFTAEAFQQDLLEFERRPELYIIISRHESGRLMALHRVNFPDLPFDAEEDLGDIRIPRRAPPLAVSPLPAYRKRARRVIVDQEHLAMALGEVAPLVEALTGWSGLLDDLRVEPVDGLGAAVQRAMQPIHASDGSAGLLDRWIGNTVMSALQAIAFYDPNHRTLYVDKRKAERQNLDGLKVIVGHELVHVGQFTHHPELASVQLDIIRRLLAAIDESEEAGNEVALHAELETSFEALANIEGYASYIENDFLRGAYRCASLLPTSSLLDLAVRFADARAFSEASTAYGLSASQNDKLHQYVLGRRAYQDLQRDDIPVRFNPELRIGS